MSSSNGTSTVSFTRVGLTVSTALFTAVLSCGVGSGLQLGACACDGAQRQAVSHRSPYGRRSLPRPSYDKAHRGRARVGVPGFEPGAFRSQSGRATKLRHTPSPRLPGAGSRLRPRTPPCGAGSRSSRKRGTSLVSQQPFVSSSRSSSVTPALGARETWMDVPERVHLSDIRVLCDARDTSAHPWVRPGVPASRRARELDARPPGCLALP